MLSVNAIKKSEILFIVITINGDRHYYDAGIYHDRMVQFFGEDYETSKQYKHLRAKDNCGGYADGLGWYMLKHLLKLNRMQKIDVSKFIKKGKPCLAEV